MLPKPVKTRFAPSPTGFLHIGGLRTALFAYLFAKKHEGTFALRIEDTDQNRFVEGAAENIIDTLHWAGIQIDEGVDKDETGQIIQKGACGPYIQSERRAIYKKYAEELIAKDKAYYAFDTTEELEEMRKRQELNKQATHYDRSVMRNQFTLGEAETKRRLDAGEPYAIRMVVPEGGTTTFTDLVRGEVRFANNQIDDQVLLKADGFPTYHLAVVVDDHLMGFTHVIRGEEWLPSTPKHLILYDAFGWEKPEHAHLSLLINEQKQKLSKRHGDVAVEDFKEKGYLPEAVVNFITFLGWNPGDERELFSLGELEKIFSFENVSKSPAVFNREKLAWYNKQYMMSMDLAELTDRALPFFPYEAEREKLEQGINLERSRVNSLSELPQALGFLFTDALAYDADLLIWKKATREDAKEKLVALYTFLLNREGEWSHEALEQDIKQFIETNAWSVGNVLWPLRTALSGQKDSPGPFEISAILGKEKTLARIQFAANLL